LGNRYLPPTGSVDIKAGWMEPISILHNALFHGAFLETRGNATLSPYQSNVGVLFNLKPVRFLEGGLEYTRLLFPHSMVGFSQPAGSSTDWLPSQSQWQTSQIFDSSLRETIGSDVFTFHGNLMVDIGRVQLLAGAFRSLWDVDTQDRDILLEYNSGLLIKKKDRINSVYAQTLLNLDPYFSGWGGFTAQGILLRDQYTWTTHTHLSENLVAVGFAGLRRGRNDDRSYHGLDVEIGYWTQHPQFNGKGLAPRLHLALQWMWNIQILHLGED
jgi:hypothetical protein